MHRDLHASQDDVSQFLPVVAGELYDVRATERAQRRGVHVLEGVRPLGDQHHRDVALRRGALLGDSGEGVDQVRAALLEQRIDLVEDHDEVELMLLEVPAEGLHLLGDGEPALREMRVEMLEESQQDGVVSHPLPAVHDVPVDRAARFGREFLEIETEPLRRVRLPRPDGAVQERVAGSPGLDDRT